MSDYTVLAHYLEALEDVSVTCVGDVMLDRFLYGRIERISPEAPIPIIQVQKESMMLGGAGNVVRNLSYLGAHARLVAVAGEDQAATEIERLLSAEGKVVYDLIIEAKRESSVKTRYIAGNQQVLRADRESVRSLSAAGRTTLLKAARAALRESAVLVLSDYKKGVLDEGIAAELIGMANACGKPVIVDPKGRDYERYRGADIVTPNRVELSEATSMQVTSADDAVVASRALIERHGFGTVLATLGPDGMAYVTSDGDSEHLPAQALEVFDISGAGDTVIATLAAMLASGTDLPHAAKISNVAAGIVVGKVGTAVTTVNEILDALRRKDVSAAEHKIKPLDTAGDHVAVWRRKGFRVGFTNGCFDLIHPGHISLLVQACRHCDRLVVGLNTDDSARRLKGSSRPVQSEAARAVVLASLAMVDMVVLFDEDTPIRLIEMLRPDLLVKGADYQLDQVVGAELVQSYGGNVLLAKVEPGFSTTSTILQMTA